MALVGRPQPATQGRLSSSIAATTRSQARPSRIRERRGRSGRRRAAPGSRRGSIAATIAELGGLEVDRHRPEPVPLVVEVALPADVDAAEHRVPVELEVHDRAVDVGDVERHRASSPSRAGASRAYSPCTSLPANDSGSTWAGSSSWPSASLEVGVGHEARAASRARGRPRRLAERRGARASAGRSRTPRTPLPARVAGSRRRAAGSSHCATSARRSRGRGRRVRPRRRACEQPVEAGQARVAGLLRGDGVAGPVGRDRLELGLGAHDEQVDVVLVQPRDRSSLITPCWRKPELPARAAARGAALGGREIGASSARTAASGR